MYVRLEFMPDTLAPLFINDFMRFAGPFQGLALPLLLNLRPVVFYLS
jgi:hypothetical protein